MKEVFEAVFYCHLKTVGRKYFASKVDATEWAKKQEEICQKLVDGSTPEEHIVNTEIVTHKVNP